MSVTQSQIAETLGLNQRTVSIAFGGSGTISPKTRRRVLDAAQRMDYRPNRLAAGLRGGETRSIGVVWGFIDSWAGDAAIGVEVLERVQRRGFATYQAQKSEEANALALRLDDLISRRADAIILQATPGQLDRPEIRQRLAQVRAVVAVTREGVADFPGDLVVHDRTPAIRQVVEHFARSGRTKPAMMLSLGQESNPPKYEAFLAACREFGIDEHRHSLIPLDYPDALESHGRRHRDGLRRAFPGPVDVDAIFCFNDTGALFVLRELQDRGVAVPDGVALVGFNNLEVGLAVRPELATGDRRRSEVAAAVEVLLERRLAHPDAPPHLTTIPMRFLWRASAGGVPPVSEPVVPFHPSEVSS